MRKLPIVAAGSSLVLVSLLAVLPSTGALAFAEPDTRVQASRVAEDFEKPRGLRRAITEAQAEETGLGQIHAPGGPALPIYLNRWGGTYYAGYDNSALNTSSIVDSGSATVSEFSGTEDQWAFVLSCVQDQFAPFNVYVTDIEPTEGDYVEAVVGGTPDQIGQPFGVGGVAPYDPFGCNIIPKAVVYAFAGVYGTSSWGLQSLCETVTQEVAHAFTLDHELLCQDPMTYLEGCGAKTFQNQVAVCGEYEDEPRACTCGDPNGQNSVQSLLSLVGANSGVEPPAPPDDHAFPEVTVLSPEDGSTFLADQPLVVRALASDDVGLVSVQLLWHLTDSALHCPGNGEGWSCSQQNDEFVWELLPGPGLREFSIRARDVVGKTTDSETLWVWMGQSLDETRPEDETPPEVTIISPLQETVIAERSYFTLTATAYDADTGILSAEVSYQGGFGTRVYGCPFESDFGSCTVVGGTYVWNIRSGRNDRTFTVSAMDYVGNVGTTSLTILAGDVSDPVPSNDGLEPNDTWDFSSEVGCGAGLDLLTHGADPDWLTVEAPAGHKVTLTLSGDRAADLDLYAHVTPTSDGILVGSQEGVVSFFQPETGARVRVQPTTGVGGAYRVDIGCEEPPVLDPDDQDQGDGDAGFTLPFLTCSHAGVDASAPPFAAILAAAGIVLGLRRRRVR